MSTHKDATPVTYAQADTPDAWPVAVGYIGLKLLGVYFVVQSLGYLPYLATILSSASLNWQSIVSNMLGGALGALWPALLGGLLIAFAHRLSSILFARLAVSPKSIDADTAVVLISVGVGLWLVAYTLPWLATEVFAILRSKSEQMQGVGAGLEPVADISYTNLVGYVLQSLIGLFMFLRPGWIVGKFRRHARFDDPTPTPAGSDPAPQEPA